MLKTQGHGKILWKDILIVNEEKGPLFSIQGILEVHRRLSDLGRIYCGSGKIGPFSGLSR